MTLITNKVTDELFLALKASSSQHQWDINSWAVKDPADQTARESVHGEFACFYVQDISGEKWIIIPQLIACWLRSALDPRVWVVVGTKGQTDI